MRKEVPGSQDKQGAARHLPDMKVLDVDIFVWGCLSLAPEEEPFFGRSLCKAHNDRKVRSSLHPQTRAQAGQSFILRYGYK